MVHKRLITIASTGLLLASTVLSSGAMAAGGLERNQAALGIAGRSLTASPACAAPVGSSFLVRSQCAVDTDATAGRGRRRGGTFLVALLAAAAVVAGLIIAIDSSKGWSGGLADEDIDTGVAPTPSPTPTASPTPMPSPTATTAPPIGEPTPEPTPMPSPTSTTAPPVVTPTPTPTPTPVSS